MAAGSRRCTTCPVARSSFRARSSHSAATLTNVSAAARRRGRASGAPAGPAEEGRRGRLSGAHRRTASGRVLDRQPVDRIRELKICSERLSNCSFCCSSSGSTATLAPPSPGASRQLDSTDQHERREEDASSETIRVRVGQGPLLYQDHPDGEERDVQVHEVHRPCVGRDPIGDAILEVLGSLLGMLDERGVGDGRRNKPSCSPLPPFRHARHHASRGPEAAGGGRRQRTSTRAVGATAAMRIGPVVGRGIARPPPSRSSAVDPPRTIRVSAFLPIAASVGSPGGSPAVANVSGDDPEGGESVGSALGMPGPDTVGAGA